MSIFDTILPWFSLQPDIYKPDSANRINQQYDFYSIFDLYLGYQEQDTDESTGASTLDPKENVNNPLLVSRFSPWKQPTIDLLTEAINRCSVIDRYRENTYKSVPPPPPPPPPNNDPKSYLFNYLGQSIQFVFPSSWRITTEFIEVPGEPFVGGLPIIGLHVCMNVSYQRQNVKDVSGGDLITYSTTSVAVSKAAYDNAIATSTLGALIAANQPANVTVPQPPDVVQCRDYYYPDVPGNEVNSQDTFFPSSVISGSFTATSWSIQSMAPVY